MGAAGGHPPYHCHAVPLHANKVSPPFSGVPWFFSTDNSDGRPEVVPLAQGPSSWAGGIASSNPWDSVPGAQPQRSPALPVRPPSGGAPQSFFADCLCVGIQGPPLRCRAPPPSRDDTVPSVCGVPRVERGPNALQGSRCTSGPAGPRGSFTPVSPRGHPGAAPLTQGLFLGPGRHCLFRPRGSTHGAQPQRPPGPAKRPQSGAAASGRATASEPYQPRRLRPSRHFIFLSPRSRSGRGSRSEPAFRNRSPPPAPRDPGITGRVKAASLARQNRVSYGRMTEGSRALSECDRHLDARSHAPDWCLF
ncbi:hypothetical protein NDU88_002541 [Pleurodeles waltl]|uniref:Uncharacterized protein n=1 Tax=Pleurodeles waltl TaxID=8319 RepID=A0AAV7QCY8_PLEWA|nr:hypothetical protein NDU88_002541 [Pleurodeles waltl]